MISLLSSIFQRKTQTITGWKILKYPYYHGVSEAASVKLRYGDKRCFNHLFLICRYSKTSDNSSLR